MMDLCKLNSYDTPPGQRDLCSRILLNSRFYFFFRTYYNYFKLGQCAKHGRFTRERQCFYCNRNIRILESCGAQLHLRGLENLRLEPGPFVLVGNHMSSVETAILNAMLAPNFDFTFVIKRSLFKVPFLGDAMRAINAIGVDRKNPREDFKTIMVEGVKRLHDGRSVLIFPESTRYSEFVPERFNTIGVKLAKAADVKIIPFALKTDFLTPGWPIGEFGPLHPGNHIHFEFGKPITITGTGREEHREITDFITRKSAEWRRDTNGVAPALSGSAPRPVLH